MTTIILLKINQGFFCRFFSSRKFYLIFLRVALLSLTEEVKHLVFEEDEWEDWEEDDEEEEDW